MKRFRFTLQQLLLRVKEQRPAGADLFAHVSRLEEAYRLADAARRERTD